MGWEGNVLEKEDSELIVSVHKEMKSGAIAKGIFIIDHINHAVTDAPLAHFNMLVARALSDA